MVDQSPPSPWSPGGGSVEDMDDIRVSSGAHRLEGVRVLIVDDDEGIRFAVRMLLEQSGAIVTDAPSAEAALVLLRQERPDVLLSDLTMPRYDGYWLIHEVRRLPVEGGGATPAAAVTGHADPADRARVLRAGFHAHLPKRALPEGLIGTVASLATRAVGMGGAPS
jgi:CheY-like chemotaxis protein